MTTNYHRTTQDLSAYCVRFPAPLLLLALCTGCSTSNSTVLPITCNAVHRDFEITVQAEGEIEAQKSHMLSAPRIVGGPKPKVSYLPPEGTFVKKETVVVEFSSDKSRADHTDALRKLEMAKSDVRATEVEQARQRSQLESQIESAEASAASARLQLARLEFVSARERQIRELEIAQSDITAEKTRKKLTLLEAVQKEESRQKMIEVKQAENKLNNAQLNLDKLVLRAPVDGYVLYETNWETEEKVRVGDDLYSGNPVVKIPDMSVLQVKLQLSETAVQKLSKDQPAEIIVSSSGNLRLPGHVLQVAKVAKPVSKGSEVKFVEVIVTIDSLAGSLVPGLSTSCWIRTDSVSQAVVIPLDAVFDKDSTHIVYLRRGAHFEPREIVLGAKDDNYSVVDSGLVGGEELALSQPGQSLLK